MRLTTRSRYGTRIVLDIALYGAKGPVRIRDISHRHGVSEKYLAKLIQELRKAKIIESKRGPRGGHVLVRDLDKLTVGEIVSVLEGERALADFGEQENVPSSFLDCIHQKIWVNASAAMMEKLNSITFDHLVEEARKCSKPDCCLKGPDRRAKLHASP